jgi:hypothetical protein
VVSRGIGGDITCGVCKCLDDVIWRQPSIIGFENFIHVKVLWFFQSVGSRPDGVKGATESKDVTCCKQVSKVIIISANLKMPINVQKDWLIDQ